MPRVVLIRHGDDPDDDRVVSYFRSKGVEPEIRKPFKGEALGDVDPSVVASVIYGGPFNVYEEDRYPFLNEEKRWIDGCMKAGVPLLGICQGSQQIARYLGAEVGPKPGDLTEFGYYEITATPAGRAYFPEKLVVSQAHWHEFQVPTGSELLATSALFQHQAFRYGDKVFGFQFHPEVTPAGFRRWQQADWAAYGKPGAQTREEQDALMAAHDGRQHTWFMNFLEQFFSRAIARS